MIIQLARFLLTLALGLLGGWVFYYFAIPAPWLLGALTFTLLLSMAGLPLLMFHRINSMTLAVIGVMLGSSFSLQLLQQAEQWLLSLSSIFFYLITVTFFAMYYCQRVAKLDFLSSWFASVPGGLSEVILLSDQLQADVRAVALFHSLRVIVILLSLPILLWFAHSHFTPPSVSSSLTFNLSVYDAFLLFACGGLGALLAIRFHAPIAMLFYPFMLSALLHICLFTTAKPPSGLIIITQLIIGSSIGCRFAGFPWLKALRLFKLGVGMVSILMGVTLVFAGGLHIATGIPFTSLMLAFAPGGGAELMLIALWLQLDPAFVAVHQLLRLTLVMLIIPLVITLWKRKQVNAINSSPKASHLT
ncbi:membrane protein AbrB duplication [Beggiatoa alba B18LD]|uniref:Membrane protein AbrB duplication n=1 Tax=Beggiatoa alba B18LD TaxID=395493 RepID=I3CCN6_9GAMM|nr:AbrB family transcriptional regulator [Beggiatoa alba]EIJ41379.1 membrane protein AbrB duplication [Beggiatoa alba B18LD]